MIRFATNDEGLAVRALTIANGANPNLAMVMDWSRAGESWLVEERGGKLVGAIQVAFGLPTARLESLSVDPGLDGRARAKVVKGLQEAALALCKQLGASAVRSFVPFPAKSLKRNYKKAGWAVVEQGNVLLRVL